MFLNALLAKQQTYTVGSSICLATCSPTSPVEISGVAHYRVEELLFIYSTPFTLLFPGQRWPLVPALEYGSSEKVMSVCIGSQEESMAAIKKISLPLLIVLNV